MQQKPKIALLLPVYGAIPSICFVNLVNFILDSLRSFPMTVSFVDSTYLPRARNMLVENFLKSGADYALFVDSDMLLPKNAVETLLGHGKEVVSAHYFRRNPPYESVAQRKAGEKYETIPEPSLGDEFEADATGMGCMLVKREVIEKLAQQKPIFTVEDKENSSVKGEDVIFCDKIKAAGYKIWVSKKVRAGHFGGIVFPAKP